MEAGISLLMGGIVLVVLSCTKAFGAEPATTQKDKTYKFIYSSENCNSSKQSDNTGLCKKKVPVTVEDAVLPMDEAWQVVDDTISVIEQQEKDDLKNIFKNKFKGN